MHLPVRLQHQDNITYWRLEVFHFKMNYITPHQYLERVSGLWENIARWTCGLLDWVRFLRLDRCVVLVSQMDLSPNRRKQPIGKKWKEAIQFSLMIKARQMEL